MEMKDARGTYLYACSLEKGLLKEYKAEPDDLAQAYKLLVQAADMNVTDQLTVVYGSLCRFGLCT
jgi:hypothetical protein